MLRHRGRIISFAVSGGDLMDGLRESGISIPRVDYILQKHVRNGFVVGTGQRRRRRYKLTAAGIECSRQIAEKLTSQIP
jgi:hypothetical protein